MSDEVRSNSSPTPPEAAGPPIDGVDGSPPLEVEIPTPDLELDAPPDSGPTARPAPAAALPPVREAAPPSSDAGRARLSERPPPPSQRAALQRAAVAEGINALPSRMSSTATLPAPPPAVTLPAPSLPVPAPVPAIPPPAPGAELSSGDARGAVALLTPVPPSPPASSRAPSPVPRTPVPGSPVPRSPVPPSPAPPRPTSRSSVEPASSGQWSGLATDPAPARMLSEPVPLMTVKSGAPGQLKPSLRPGLVEPKRIIEVLGSNVPVLDSALDEEDGIEDLDESEAHELADTPIPDSAVPVADAELELPVVVEEDLPPPIDVALEAPASGALPDSAAALDSRSEASPASDALDAPAGPGSGAKVPPKRRRPPPPSSRMNEKPRPEPGPRKWWEEMFSEEFLRAIPILSQRQLEREVHFIDEALGVDRGGRILDLACGAGQHAVELAARGYDVVGYDLSQSQLDWAGGLARERGQRVQLTCGDMRELAYNEAFDAVYCWNTSFGFFEEEKNVDVAHRIFRALRPGGRFLLDVINRDFVVAQQPGQTWFEGDGCVCIDDVSIDFITSRMKVKRTLMLTTGKNRECSYSLRMYGLHELGKILHDVGFKVLNVSGRPEMPGVFFGATSPRIIILAVKP